MLNVKKALLGKIKLNSKTLQSLKAIKVATPIGIIFIWKVWLTYNFLFCKTTLKIISSKMLDCIRVIRSQSIVIIKREFRLNKRLDEILKMKYHLTNTKINKE